jgi:hypothetical protein
MLVAPVSIDRIVGLFVGPFAHWVLGFSLGSERDLRQLGYAGGTTGTDDRPFSEQPYRFQRSISKKMPVVLYGHDRHAG